MSKETVNILDFKIILNENCQLLSDITKKQAFSDVDISAEVESIKEKFTRKFEKIYDSVVNKEV